jgi:hypothetical protein
LLYRIWHSYPWIGATECLDNISNSWNIN